MVAGIIQEGSDGPPGGLVVLHDEHTFVHAIERRTRRGRPQ